ncbi:MAG: Zn-dependent hydrolase, partial [Gemmatimonadota bacterium]|nr:Zn-dependent hydrolase [Gemmatimonadota bacterium]
MRRRRFIGHAASLAAIPLVVRPPRRAPLQVNGARLNSWLSRFDAVGRTAGGINRVGYSEADLAGRAFALDLFREAGLAPRIDAAGNIIGRMAGRDRSLPPIIIGSHIDSVTDG